MPRPSPYEQVASGIAAYLAERQQRHGGFPGPDHYGVAFAVWLWSHFAPRFDPQIELALRRLESHLPRSHGEFNAYALLQCRQRLGPQGVDGILGRLRLDGRRTANWALLRAACRAHLGPWCSRLRAAAAGRLALGRYARGGFICDQRGVRSAAYHAFSGGLLADLWRAQRFPWAARAALRAAQAVLALVLPNGDAVYVGRGQHQIFGIGALLWLLEAAAGMSGRDTFRAAARRVFDYLLQHRRADGSFPLVLQDDEPPEPWDPDASRPGWYSYNRYADYLPFLGCMFLRAAAPGVRPTGSAPADAALPGMAVIVRARYTAVLSEPGGAPTNDLAFPYVCVDGESLFPCYGAEGRETPPGSLALPFGVLEGGRRYEFRDRLRYRLRDGALEGASASVRHARRFEFQENGFVCRDEIAFRRSAIFSEFSPANFLFRTLRPAALGGFETWWHGARARLALDAPAAVVPEAAVSASGRLVALRNVRGRFTARRGDVLRTELRVEFP